MIDFICLDAKYRVSRHAVLDAMVSAHIYHDSIRREGKRALASFILTPNVHEVSGLADPKYRELHHAGVIALCCASDARAIWNLLMPE